MNTEKKTLTFVFYSALSVTLLTIITWGFAMTAIPPSGPYCVNDCMSYPFTDLMSYYPRDYYWMYFAIFQLFAYLIFMISTNYISKGEARLFGFISVAFGLIASIVLLTAYFIQFSVIPMSMTMGESEGIALLTQYNGHGIFIAMEDLGFITMSMSFLFLSFAFSFKTRLEKAIRIILTSAFLLTLISFVFYSIRFGIDRSYRFEVAAITVNWTTTIVIGILVCVFISKKLKSIQ